jgi:hypothetical protein
MRFLNKWNFLYSTLKRGSPFMSLEAYDNLAHQIKRQPGFIERPPLIRSGCDFLIVVPGLTIILFFAVTTSYGFFALLYDIVKHPILHDLAESIFRFCMIPVLYICSSIFFKLLWAIYLVHRTGVELAVMEKHIRQGTLVLGKVDEIRAVFSQKKKIGYSFVLPNNDRLQGCFFTSTTKALNCGDEIAIWYMNNSLHVIL